MNTAELIESRRAHWQELEALCGNIGGHWKGLPPEVVSRFSSLYRATCADLALADAYQMPPDTVLYLHRLVGAAHNRLYRRPAIDWRGLAEEMLVRVPQRLFRDNCVRLAFIIFWGVFALTFFSAYFSPDFATQVLGKEMISQLEDNFANTPSGRPVSADAMMTGFYIFNNPRIGLQCFAFGMLLGFGGLYITLFNAAVLGATFGYMAQARPPLPGNFFHFVTAHGPMELTAIVLCAAAGMRLGFALIDTRAGHEGSDELAAAGEGGGAAAARGLALGADRSARRYVAGFAYARLDSLRRAARVAAPTVGAAMIMFVIAALIEGFLSPSALPYYVKAFVGVGTAGLLIFYFVFLGVPQEEPLPAAAETRRAGSGAESVAVAAKGRMETGANAS